MPHVPLAVSDKFKGKSEQGLFGDVMTEIDWSVGELLKALGDNGLEKNTLVIFTSDNGPWINFGNHAGTTGALREGKGGSFEGGQCVPCLMKWPGNIAAETVCDKLASTIDILPTLAAITGSSPKHGSWLDIAEIELSALGNQCLSKRRISSVENLNEELLSWNTERNAAQKSVNWQFKTADARIKLKHLYPILNF